LLLEKKLIIKPKTAKASVKKKTNRSRFTLNSTQLEQLLNKNIKEIKITKVDVLFIFLMLANVFGYDKLRLAVLKQTVLANRTDQYLSQNALCALQTVSDRFLFNYYLYDVRFFYD
jgi:hypothetical protein